MAEELLTVVDENDAPLRSDTRAALHRGDGVLHRAARAPTPTTPGCASPGTACAPTTGRRSSASARCEPSRMAFLASWRPRLTG